MRADWRHVANTIELLPLVITRSHRGTSHSKNVTKINKKASIRWQDSAPPISGGT